MDFSVKYNFGNAKTLSIDFIINQFHMLNIWVYNFILLIIRWIIGISYSIKLLIAIFSFEIIQLVYLKYIFWLHWNFRVRKKFRHVVIFLWIKVYYNCTKKYIVKINSQGASMSEGANWSLVGMIILWGYSRKALWTHNHLHMSNLHKYCNQFLECQL